MSLSQCSHKNVIIYIYEGAYKGTRVWAHEGGNVAPWVSRRSPRPVLPGPRGAHAHDNQRGLCILITCDSSQILNTGDKCKFFFFYKEKFINQDKIKKTRGKPNKTSSPRLKVTNKSKFLKVPCEPNKAYPVTRNSPWTATVSLC